MKALAPSAETDTDIPTIVRVVWQHSYSRQWAWITAYGIKLGELHHIGGGWYELECCRGTMKIMATCEIGDVDPIVSAWIKQVELCEHRPLSDSAKTEAA